MKYKGGLLPPVHERRKMFGEYDKRKLVAARDLIEQVHDFHFGVPGMSGKLKRLETLMKKLDALIEEEESDE